MRKILIVGTVPYNQRMTSRSFDAYFHGYEKNSLAQIFSHPKMPTKGHCHTFYQITDQRMVLRRFQKEVQTGTVFQDAELPNCWEDLSPEGAGALFRCLYRLGTYKTPLNHLLRGWVWKQAYWCSEELNCWLDAFSPECVFLAFSDDFFILQIALYVAQRFRIPILSCIGDDYYFNNRFSLSPFYYLYRHRYRKLVQQVVSHGGSAIYISDKIRDQYNTYFGLRGETIFLSSELVRREFTPLPEDSRFAYFGNLGLGRGRSLYELGRKLQKISPKLHLDIYSNQQNFWAQRLFHRCPAIRFHGAVPYSRVQEEIKKTDVFVVVEGFRKVDQIAVRYSLSTKAADALVSGAQILVYGSGEAGVVSYLERTGAATVCTQKAALEKTLRKLLGDIPAQRQRYEQAKEITQKNHTRQSSTRLFRTVVERTVHAFESCAIHTAHQQL